MYNIRLNLLLAANLLVTFGYLPAFILRKARLHGLGVNGADAMLPPSQIILLVILIVLALVLLNWEANNTVASWEEGSDERARRNPGLTKPDQN